MPNITNLQHRVNKLLEQVGPPPAEPYKFPFEMSLFTAEEQARLQRFLAQVEPKYSYIRDHLELDKLTREEVEELGQWIRLQDALERQDSAAAAKYRRYLAPGYQEQLIQRFLATDENTIPKFDQAPDYIDKYGTCYTLYRTYFRSDRARIERQLQRGSLLPGEVETIHMWLEHFPPTVSTS